LEKDTGSVEETWEVIKSKYTDVAQEVLGYEKRKRNKPWISKEVLDLSDTRKELRKTKSHNEDDKRRYRKITTEIKRKAKKCKEMWIEEKCQELENNARAADTGKLFQMAKEICGSNITKLASIKNKEGRTLDDREEIKQRWKQHYEEMYNNGNPVDRTVLEELPIGNKQEQMMNILESEVESAIRNLKSKKGTRQHHSRDDTSWRAMPNRNDYDA